MPNEYGVPDPPSILSALHKRLGRRPTVVEEARVLFDAHLKATNHNPPVLTRADVVDPPPDLRQRILEHRTKGLKK